MGTPDAKKPRHFWASPFALKLVREGVGNPSWEPKAGQEVWEALRDEIVAFNSRGLVKPPDAPKVSVNGVESYLLVDGQPLPEKYDHMATYPVFKNRLATLARLLQAFRRRLIVRVGKTKGLTLERLAKQLRDPRSQTFLQLACTIGSLDDVAGMHALEAISKKGLRWTLPGGIEQWYRDRDCGIEPLVHSTRLALRLLARIEARQAKGAVAAVGPKRRIEVVEHEGIRFELVPRGRDSIQVDGNAALLFRVLYDYYDRKDDGHEGWAPYKVILETIWPEKLPDATTNGDADRKRVTNKPFNNKGSVENYVAGKAPGALTRAKSDIETAIREVLGYPGGDRRAYWIETKTGEAFRLNQTHVVWWHKKVAANRVNPEHRGRGR